MIDELLVYIRARYTLIWLLTSEEERVVADLTSLAREQKKKLVLWSHPQGFHGPGPGAAAGTAKNDPIAALEAVPSLPDNALVALLDFHPFLQDAGVVRRVRELGATLEGSRRTLLFVAPVLVLPVELEKDVVVVDVALPSPALLRSTLESIAASLPAGARTVMSERDVETLIRTAQGLTTKEFGNALAKAVVSSGRIDRDAIDVVNAEKRQTVRKSGVLDYYAVSDGMSAVGGLDSLKGWLTSRGKAFSDDARRFGLPFPKGALIVGVQGCGKSLSAKAVAAQWRLPLVKLDAGRLFAGLVGASEQKMRDALKLAEAVAPCVLWIDEIEKGFSGLGSSNVSDGGTTARVIGTFLTWMQEKTAPVFVIATSNDIAAMPPELLRKGRFDEIFFVDLPNEPERRAIFTIHLKRRSREVASFDLPALVRAARGFSGAEIEQAVIDGMFLAYEAGRELATEDIERACGATVPLSVLMEERISALRGWAKDRTRPATGHKARTDQELAALSERILRVALEE